jgi:uncharacterized membrane protein YccC
MAIPNPLDLLRRWAARDPHYYALRRAARAAVVIPVNFAIGSELIGNAQTATLCAFGSFALLLFVDFPGNRGSRAAAYGVLAAVGAVLITAGTLLSRPSWLAVTAMAVVGFLVLFAGVVSSTIAVAGRAALLTFILPVMVAGTAADIPDRLLGWAIACAVAIPVALFVWPPEDQNQLRVRAATLCHALAHAIEVNSTETGVVDPRNAVADLRTAFRASAARPVALSTGSRMLMRLVDELEWLTTTVASTCGEPPDEWGVNALALRNAAAEALHACAHVLQHNGGGPTASGCEELNRQIEALSGARAAVAQETLDELRAASGQDDAHPAGDFDRPLYAAHELGYVVTRTCATVSLIAAADSRDWFARLLGRQVGPEAPGEAVAAERIAISHLDLRSVWLQNSVRAAVGLALAVLVARVSDQQEGFWIVLGALSVLRSNALSTGSTALRAVGGTAVGFAIGGLLVAAIGTSPAVLWPLLPVAIFIAAYTPDVISFAAGQAAFTVVVIILFNIIAPAGWRIGVLRIEDVALGCLSGVVAGLLFWPRGAGAALGRALAEAYSTGAEHVARAIDYVAGRSEVPPDAHGTAQAASSRLDVALRQYLAERGAKHVPLESVTTLANGAVRLRMAGEAITRLKTDDSNGYGSLESTVELLVEQTGHVTGWYHALSDEVGGATTPLPPVEHLAADASFLDVVLPAITSCGDPGRAAIAERLLWSGQYVGDVNRMREELVAPAAKVRQTRLRPFWQR